MNDQGDDYISTTESARLVPITPAVNICHFFDDDTSPRILFQNSENQITKRQ